MKQKLSEINGSDRYLSFYFKTQLSLIIISTLYRMVRQMKLNLTLLLCIFSLTAFCQSDNPKYDKSLADSLGGDEYGMKAYVLVILKTGTNKTEDKTALDHIFKGHMENMDRLAKEGKLIVAGPLGKNDKTYRGIFILNVKTIAEANELLQTDLSVQEKVFEAEFFTWYGSAALPMYLPFHDKVEKKKM